MKSLVFVLVKQYSRQFFIFNENLKLLSPFDVPLFVTSGSRGDLQLTVVW